MSAQILRQAIVSSNDRFLFSNSKWYFSLNYRLSELLIGNRLDSNSLEFEIQEDQPLDGKLQDLFFLAHSWFSMKEYLRVYQLIDSLHPKLLFLKFYSKYLFISRGIECSKLLDSNSVLYGMNHLTRESKDFKKNLDDLSSEMSDYMDRTAIIDSFMHYLLVFINSSYGLVQSKRQLYNQALDHLIMCVNMNPLNWSAWVEIGLAVQNASTLTERVLPFIDESIVKKIFLAYMSNELVLASVEDNNQIEQTLQDLLEIFPKSTFLKGQLGVYYYNKRDFLQAEQIFSDLLNSNSSIIDWMDYYSNVLYVMEKRSELSSLAHNVSKTEPYRPETCCIIGNYYSLRGNHNKAISYFERALKLNKNYLQAWTLMGHEFLELKNSPTAIECYRKATGCILLILELNSKDYRAWYGLGQTYEMLKMPTFALYYYQKATSLRPNDSRMWAALGQTYSSIDRKLDAIKCYKRALCIPDYEPSVLCSLGTLYNELDKPQVAHDYYKMCFSEYKSLDIDSGSKEFETCCLFLCSFYKEKGDFTEAFKYCKEILHTEQGKTLKRELE